MKRYNNNKAFTMVELVMVVLVMGLLAALAIPRLDRDRTQEAADTILSDIRYAQHMAINDYRENPRDSEWQKTFWQVKIESCADDTGLFISIGADKDKGGDIDKIETAIDPANGKPMFWLNTKECDSGGDGTVSENVFLTYKFGVKSIETSGGCDNFQYIGFDHLGRPHVGFSSSSDPDYSSYMDDNCTMKFEMKGGSKSFTIKIAPETGYAYIVDQNAS